MMRSRLLSLLALAPLITGVSVLLSVSASTPNALAATPGYSLVASVGKPTLRLDCGIPNSQNIVGCQLSGRGFRPQERLRITYRLAFTALPRVHGHLQGQVYTRTATTDGKGAFSRPPLRFGVVRYHESFRLTATVVGASGDRATITTAAMAQ